MSKEIKLHKSVANIIGLYKVIKRRKKIFYTYHKIEKFMKRLNDYQSR